MANALNMTLKLKQDPATQAALAQFARDFPQKVQPKMEQALRTSQLVHFARVLVIGSPPQYLQVITAYDGDPVEYTEFFRIQLNDIFQEIFSLVDGAPPWDELNNRDSFFAFSSGANLPSVGNYLFSAYGTMTVRDIQSKLS
jgi:hypothetical protein